MDFYTVVLKKSFEYWVALCLENGIVGQGETQDDAIEKLEEAIESVQEFYQFEPGVYCASISIEELSEFL